MKKKKILDKNINARNYLKFKKSRRLDNGKNIEFFYANGESYVVPSAKIQRWFKQPHHFIKKGRKIEFNKKKHKTSKNRKIIGVRRVLMNSGVRIYFSDKTACDVAWDTVLMACEPLYEHYGGLKRKA